MLRGAAAKLEIDGRLYTPVAVRRFGQFDSAGNIIERGGKWQYVDLGPEFALSQPGMQYSLTLVFDAPVPKAETAKIAVDLSQALRDPSQPPLPLIQVRKQRSELGRQHLLGLHGPSHTTSMAGQRSKVNVIY